MLKEEAYAYALSRIKGIGPGSAVKILREFPNLDHLMHTSQTEIAAKLGRELTHTLDASLAREWHSLWEMAQETMQRHVDKGISPISLVNKSYPALLKLIPDPPVILFTKGKTALLKKTDMVAVIGTRSSTERGQQVAYKVAQAFAQQDYTIVSGLAKGIDAAAHLAALDSHGSTIAVLGTSLDKIYPAENKLLAKRIIDASGILVSEVALGQPSFRSSFVQRNRIQSGLSLAVIPIQTDIDGGTMHTVRFAEEQQRLIFCPKLPGYDQRFKQSTGILALLNSGRAIGFTRDDYPMIFKKLSEHKVKLLSSRSGKSVTEKRIEGEVVQGMLTLKSISTYPDLPLELRRFWTLETTYIPKEIRSVITAGWIKMSDSQKARLIESLSAKTDPLETILLANQEATKALLS